MDRNNNINNFNIRNNIIKSKYCQKCITLLPIDANESRIVKDHCGRSFCSTSCRKEYHLEIRRDSDCNYNEFRDAKGSDGDGY